jgi:nitrate reductase NapAB chaperone NapD
MSILGAVVRVRPEHLPSVAPRLAALRGVDISLNPGDGRLVLVMEDVVDERDADGVTSAAATLTAIASWPDVLSTSLVYEYSGPDAPPLVTDDMSDFRAWRGNPASSPTLSTDKSVQVNHTEIIV